MLSACVPVEALAGVEASEKTGRRAMLEVAGAVAVAVAVALVLQKIASLSRSFE